MPALIQATGDFASFLESYPPLSSVRCAHEEWRGQPCAQRTLRQLLPPFTLSLSKPVLSEAEGSEQQCGNGLLQKRIGIIPFFSLTGD